MSILEGIDVIRINGIYYHKNPVCKSTREDITYTDMHPPDVRIKEDTKAKQREDVICEES